MKHECSSCSFNENGCPYDALFLSTTSRRANVTFRRKSVTGIVGCESWKEIETMKEETKVSIHTRPKDFVEC